MDVIDIHRRCGGRSVVIVVELAELLLGLLEICKKCQVIGEVKLQALIGDPWVEN